MNLGLVVVTYRSGDVLGGFLDSVASSSLLPDEVVIVDNSPTPVSAPKKSSLSSVQVLHQPDNPGYGTAANVGIQALGTQCDWVVVCNPDILVDKDTLKVLMTEATSHPHAGSLGPAIRNEDGSLYPSARALPALGIGIGHGLLGVIWPGNPWTKAYRGDYVSSDTREAGWLSGSFLLLKRDAFEQIGGFDEKYFMFFEDVDLGWRLAKAGYINLYVPGAAAIHEGGHSTKSNYSLMLTAHHQSAVRFIGKRYPGSFWAPIRGIIGLGLTLREKILRGRALQLSRS